MTTLTSIVTQTFEDGEKHAYWMARMKLIELGDYHAMFEWLKERTTGIIVEEENQNEQVDKR